MVSDFPESYPSDIPEPTPCFAEIHESDTSGFRPSSSISTRTRPSPPFVYVTTLCGWRTNGVHPANVTATMRPVIETGDRDR